MSLQNSSIFFVEDNLQNRIIYQTALIRYNVAVKFERWGREAVNLLQTMPHVDLIVLDLMLADGVSGFDIFDEIRALPQYAEVPVVAVSAMDPSIAMQKAQAKGFAGFIAKPINSRLFPQQLATILDGESVWYTGERTW